MPPKGRGEVKILHVAQAPGKVEDLKNEQLIGPAGTLYKRCLKKAGMELDAGLKTNSCICYPPGDKRPTSTQLKACYPNLRKTIEEFKPHVIIALGDCAMETLINHKFSSSPGKITTFRGHIIPDREYNAWICPTYHPSFVMRDTTPVVAEHIFIEDLRHAVKMLDVPLPYYTKQNETDKIEILKHPKQATKWLNSLLTHARSTFMTAFDYETASLKPQREDTYIRTCAISKSADHAVAFQMFDDNDFLNAFKKYLMSKSIKKIAANMKFEQNWSNVKLKTNVNGWLYDTMIGAHYLDNRKGITSLEFQNYVNFGIEPYDYYVKKFIKKHGSRGNEINDIDLCDLHDLLIYNGMDAMTEFRLALVQMHRLKMEYDSYYDCITNVRPEQLAPQYFLQGG
jgi:DNA polymerase